MNHDLKTLRSVRRLFFGLGIILAGLMVGCARKKPPMPENKPAEVIVGKPVFQLVTDYEDYTGHTEPFKSVDIRSQVTGYLTEIAFTDGQEIKVGDPLFSIDPVLFKAEVVRNRGLWESAVAHRDRLEGDLKRANETRAKNRDAITVEELAKINGDYNEAKASVASARGALDTAEANLRFTSITAPISGRLSKRQIDIGNLVKANDQILTNIKTLDPIYATFDIDERSLLKIRRLIASGLMPSARESKTVKVLIGVADEEGHSLSGTVEFAENAVESSTGTLRVRAILPNQNMLLFPSQAIAGTAIAPSVAVPGKNLLLSAGLYVRVRLPVGRPRMALLIPEDAIGSDQGQKYVFVVKATTNSETKETENKVEQRDVKLGPLVGSLRVIESGLEKDETVIVEGLQRARKGAKVAPKFKKNDA